MRQRLSHLTRGHERLLLMQLPVAAVVVVVLLWRVDILEGVRRLSEIDLRWAVPGVFAFTISKAVHAYRWRVFLWTRPEIPFRHLFTVFLISNLANALIPFRAGDLLRVEIPGRRYGVPRAELAGGVFVVESVLDGVAFAILLLASLVLLDVPEAIRPLLLIATVGAAALFVGALWLARRDSTSGARLERSVRRIPGRPGRWIAAWLPQFLEGLGSLRSMRTVVASVALSIAAWLLEAGVYWMMGQAFGLELALAEVLLVMIAANLIVSVPLTPWAIGPYEIAVAEVLVLIGATRGDASTYAIGSHLLLQLWIAITGVIAMLLLDMRPRDLVAVSREASEATATPTAAPTAGPATREAEAPPGAD